MNPAGQLAETDYGDGDGVGVDPLLVLLRFSSLVQDRGGPFKAVVMELLQRATVEAAEGSEI